MDHIHFDEFVTAAARLRTRRAALRFGVAGVLLAGLRPGGTAAATRCGPCQRKKHGRCRGKRPNGAPCNGTGQCFGGRCIARPACLATGTDCTADTAPSRCSSVCHGDLHCQNSGAGNPCLATSDCISPLQCVAFVCR